MNLTVFKNTSEKHIELAPQVFFKQKRVISHSLTIILARTGKRFVKKTIVYGKVKKKIILMYLKFKNIKSGR